MYGHTFFISICTMRWTAGSYMSEEEEESQR